MFISEYASPTIFKNQKENFIGNPGFRDSYATPSMHRSYLCNSQYRTQVLTVPSTDIFPVPKRTLSMKALGQSKKSFIPTSRPTKYYTVVALVCIKECTMKVECKSSKPVWIQSLDPSNFEVRCNQPSYLISLGLSFLIYKV